MTLRAFLLENFAGDLEYHPRRALVYICLAIGAANVWFFASDQSKMAVTPLVCALGSLSLLGKGIFLFRKSSEGIGLTYRDHVALEKSAARKELPSLPTQAAQILQDFGTGSLFLWPLLRSAKDFNYTWTEPAVGGVALTGAVLFALGWIVRRATSAADVVNPSAPAPPSR